MALIPFSIATEGVSHSVANDMAQLGWIPSEVPVDDELAAILIPGVGLPRTALPVAGIGRTLTPSFGTPVSIVGLGGVSKVLTGSEGQSKQLTTGFNGQARTLAIESAGSVAITTNPNTSTVLTVSTSTAVDLDPE